jgi:hypothetical protein
LVVITILAIISVVAYQNFGWAVDKAISGRKISDVSTIETALQQYKADKNYYPPTDEYSDTNLWGYTWTTTAYPSNTIKVTYEDQEISLIIKDDTKWWWKMNWSWTLSWTQIGSKWTISQKTLWKRYLTRDLYDPELWDILEKSTSEKFIKKWIWRYVYAIYKKWGANSRWDDYNISYTIKKENSDIYITKVSWTYDNNSCFKLSKECPNTLIWSGSLFLEDWNEQVLNSWVIDTMIQNQWIPYPVNDFTKKVWN